jgi:peptide/nickel transport system substrate-binding protein
MPSLRALFLIPLMTLAACGRSKDVSPAAAADSPGGTLVVATGGAPDNLMPPITIQTAGQQVEDLVFQHLATVGVALNTVGDAGFAPDLATSWDWAKDSLSIAFHLDPKARWHDGARVTAADVAFTFALYTDPKTGSPAAAQLVNIDSVSVRDSLTAVFWFKKRTPDQFFSATMQMQILPAHLLRALDHATLASAPIASQPVGSGPFRLVRWETGKSVELVADTSGGRRRARLDRVIFTQAPDPLTAFTRVSTGEADLYEAVRPDKVAEVTKNPQLRMLIEPALTYTFLVMNLLDPATGKPHPVFGDRAVRRALTMATDRRSIVANIYDSLAVPARGPFTSAQASADTSLKPLPYSVDSANKLLDAAGWVRGADSLRRKNGKVLGFAIAVPSSSVARMRAAVLFQEQFRRVGADVKIESSDNSAFGARMFGRKFDATIGTWAQDAGASNARDAWTTAAAAPGLNNVGAYRSPAFDAELDSALTVMSATQSHTHFAHAWKIITDDAPAIWLAEPRLAMVVNSRFVTTGMRADSWWAGLAKWYIPADKRIARDAPAPVAH